MSELNSWPFDQPRNCAVFTLRQIIVGSDPILRVYRDEEDEAWQFLGASAVEMKDAMLVALSEVVAKDETLYQIADLKPGWRAWRETANAPWQRSVYEEAA